MTDLEGLLQADRIYIDPRQPISYYALSTPLHVPRVWVRGGGACNFLEPKDPALGAWVVSNLGRIKPIGPKTGAEFKSISMHLRVVLPFA